MITQRVEVSGQIALAEGAGHAGHARLPGLAEAGLLLLRLERQQGEGGRKQVNILVRSQNTQASPRGLCVAINKSKYS